jgi:N,N'-diacetyllegionaminate synthase
MKTFVIAEAGANHNRDFDQALALIDAATAAKASAVKFQTYSSNTLYSKNTPDFAGYKNIPDLIKSIELPREWQRDLKLYCDDQGIEFMSTPFDERAVDELYDLGVKRFKIAGFESTDPRFVKYVASSGLPLIVSAGIGMNLESISTLITWIKEENKDADVTILHCNNAYPTPPEDINLLQIPQILKTYPSVQVGLSDHTEGILIPPPCCRFGGDVH